MVSNVLCVLDKGYTLLFQLQQLGYEIKRGKHVSVKGGNQKRFVRHNILRTFACYTICKKQRM